MSTPATETEKSPEPSTGYLVGALLCGLLLLLPLRITLDSRSYNGTYLLIFAGLAVAIGFGFVLRAARLPHGVAVAATTAGCFGALVPIFLFLISFLPAPGDDQAVTLLAGLPTAAVAAAATAVILVRGRGVLVVAASFTCVLGLIVCVAAGIPAADRVRDAQGRADAIAELTDSRLQPYLVQLPGMTREESMSTYRRMDSGALTGYGWDYYLDGNSPYSDPSVQVSIKRPDPTDRPCLLPETCRQGNGYTVVTSGGQPNQVYVDTNGFRIAASFDPSQTGLPDADTIGAALADADRDVEWRQLVD